MIGRLFETLSNALQATPSIALAASFAWGILSILLSPCHLASIPLIIGFINDQGKITVKRALLLSLLFSLGILLSIAMIGLVTGMMGRLLGDLGEWANYVVAAVFFIVGLHLMGLLPLPFIGGISDAGMKRRGLFAAFLLGLIFGIALGPCTFAFMAPILAITFSLSSTQLWYGVALLFSYGLGHCSVIVAAGTSVELVEDYLSWNEASKGAVILKKLCGLLIIFAGIFLIFPS
jgi:cytochrome c-type biogenesis protein